MPESRDTPGRRWSATVENRAVEAYLRYIAFGELPMPEQDASTAGRIETLNTRIENEPRLFVKAQLIAERHQLTSPPAPLRTPEELEEDFVKHAGSFSARQSPPITYAVWREMGVKPAVLKRAGLEPTPAGVKLALDDPKRQRAYAPRRTWTDDDKREFVAFFQANGREATAEKYGGTLMANQQRFYGFRKGLGIPNPTNKGRPPKKKSA